MFLDTTQVHITNEQIKTIWDYLKDYSFIITLLLGALLGFGVDKFKEWLKFIQKRKYFFYSLFNLNKGVEQQIILYNNYIKEVESEVNGVPSLAINMNFTTKPLDSISQEDMFKILITKGNKKNKFRILDLNTIQVWFEKIHFIINTYTDNKTLYDSNKNRLDYFQTSLKALHIEHDKMQSEYKNLDIDENFKAMLEELNKVSYDFEQNITLKEDITVFKYMRELIEPFKEILKKYNYEYHELNRCLNTVEHSFHMIVNNRKHHIDFIKVDLNDLHNINKYLTKLLSEYKKYLDDDLIKYSELIKSLLNSK